MRVNFNMPDELLARLDAYAKENYISRSAVMCQSCDNFLMAKQAKQLFAQMTETMKVIVQKGEIDEETQKHLDDFERVASLFSGHF